MNDWTARIEQLEARNKALEAVNAELVRAANNAESILDRIGYDEASARLRRAIGKSNAITATEAMNRG